MSTKSKTPKAKTAKTKTAKAKAPKAGDHVTWSSSEGTISGTVVKKLTSPMDIKGHHVAASRDNPELLVKSTKTGALAAHKPKSVRKKAK